MAAIKTIDASTAQPYTEGIDGVVTKYLSKVTMPDGSSAYIKDALARQTMFH
jgi:hypothetical protein